MCHHNVKTSALLSQHVTDPIQIAMTLSCVDVLPQRLAWLWKEGQALSAANERYLGN